jgi:dTDP-L-rhamnose 4-epimerase
VKRVLITGGAGFIGAHVAHELLESGIEVRALDCLTAQVHGAERQRPAYLSPDVELHQGDVRDPEAVLRALRDVDAVVHLAALVGVGQSMYQVAEYTSVNAHGTAVLMEALIERPVERVVVASSMSIYGEGAYRDANGRPMLVARRTLAQLQAGDWEPKDSHGRLLEAVATDENKTPSLSSVYALSKFDQERLCLLTAQAYGFSAVALRLFNAYGPFQALSNPYTGVLAIFAARLLNGQSPLINEDGLQRRDFVSVYDVARAFRLALETPNADNGIFNIGSGRSISVLEVARMMASAVGRSELAPSITEKYRVGDIRHCFADIGAARRVLGFEPRLTLEDGVAALAEWLSDQVAVDRVEEARAELESKGLAI